MRKVKININKYKYKVNSKYEGNKGNISNKTKLG